MKKNRASNLLILLILVSIALLSSCSQQQQEDKELVQKKTLRRSESYFGLHFDFHASVNDSLIGKSLTYEMVDSMLEMVRPDYIQVDCKGHPGISSYPTKVGNPAPGFVKDPLKIFREATKKHDVALYVHYSGVWDIESGKKHPEWEEIDENGKNRDGKMSVKGPYVDSLLIPQFKELIDNYKIDGCWIDGECWAVRSDYSPNMLEAFKKGTGIQTVPRSSSDPGWFEFCEFNRRAFREYIDHYADELHKYNPDFQVASNWAFSSLMPEPVDIDVDFISGDFSPSNSVQSGLYEARCIAPQGKPWDLMSWSFYYDGNSGLRIQKSAVQLQQLAATVLSMGGGYQIYFSQNRDASFQPWLFGTMKDVASFCRERQPFCEGAKPIPQVALLYSTANYKKSKSLYGNDSKISDCLKGTLNMLLDKQNAVEILMEHHLEGKMGDYPLIVVPECKYLEDGFKTELLNYVEGGGNLLVLGAGATALFTEQLGVTFKGPLVEKSCFMSSNGQMAGIIKTGYQPFVPGGDAEICGYIYPVQDFSSPSQPAATITPYGKGKIAGVYIDIAKDYLESVNPVYRDFVNNIVEKLFPEPIARVEGSGKVVLTVNDLNGKMAVNLINMSGGHSNPNVARYDKIPEVGPFDLLVRLGGAPQKVTLQPENISLDFSYSDGLMKSTIDELGIYSIVIIE